MNNKAYTYQADIYCEDCGLDIRNKLSKHGKAPANPDDETTYDSDDYPKGPDAEGGGPADRPQHCGSRADCINAVELVDSHDASAPPLQPSLIGVPLENPLTDDGIEYVREAIEAGGDVATQIWADIYSDVL